MKLLEYLLEKEISIADFAKKSGLPRSTIYRVVANKSIRISTAIKIKKSTEGYVLQEDLPICGIWEKNI